MKKLLVLQAAGLGYEFAVSNGYTEIAGMSVQKMPSVFPAVTCTAQATLRTGLSPAEHGMICNGFWNSMLQRPAFWEQSCRIVAGKRIWEKRRAAGGTVGMAFFQQSLGEEIDAVVSPAPIHKHGGGMVMGCYSKPDGLEEFLTRAAGRKFTLSSYWGPLSSPRGSDWIADAISAWLSQRDCPSLLFAYLPALDYDLQRFGPEHGKSKKALRSLIKEIEKLVAAAKKNGYDVALYGDYAIENVSLPVFPNRALAEAGLFKTRNVAGMAYPDFWSSRVFAVCDHQIAMVQCRDEAAAEPARRILSSLPGIGEILDRSAQEARGVRHERTGDFLLVAESGAWFAYPWWTNPAEAPDFAAHVDIHNKPGYDPCELFFGWPNPFHVSQDASKIRGSHGRQSEVVFASTCELSHDTLATLASSIRDT